jgi:hypothetical protein
MGALNAISAQAPGLFSIFKSRHVKLARRRARKPAANRSDSRWLARSELRLFI